MLYKISTQNKGKHKSYFLLEQRECVGAALSLFFCEVFMLRDDKAAVQQVLQAERDWLNAFRQLDVVALARMMADEYMQVGSRGQLVSKQEVLASLRSGARSWDEAESDEYRVQVYGGTALVY